MYKFYFFGSENSVDIDVMVNLADDYSNNKIEQVKENREQYGLKPEWDLSFIKIEDGIVTKSSPVQYIASVNNCLFSTFKNHNQKYPIPIVRTLPLCLKKSVYRYENIYYTLIKKYLNEDINSPIYALQKKRKNSTQEVNNFISLTKQINDLYIELLPSLFNCLNVDELKRLSYYIVQLNYFLKNKTEFYTKNEYLKKYPEISSLIKRESHTHSCKTALLRIVNENSCLLLQNTN